MKVNLISKCSKFFLALKNKIIGSENIENAVDLSQNDRVLRRIAYLDPNFIKPDGTPASSSFTLKKYGNGQIEDGLSVDLERLTSYPKSIQDITKYRLFALNVEFIRSLNLICVSSPIKGNPAHSLIKGNITKSVARNLAINAVKIKYPTDF